MDRAWMCGWNRLGWRLLVITVGVALLGSTEIARAEEMDASSVCLRPIEQIARETGIPTRVLYALAVERSGRTTDSGFVPWPWVVMANSGGIWFESKESAEAYRLEKLIRERPVRVGCFLLPDTYDNEGATAALDLLDPITNAGVAAEVLLDAFRDTNSWEAAIRSFDPLSNDGSRPGATSDVRTSAFASTLEDSYNAGGGSFDRSQPESRRSQNASTAMGQGVSEQ